MLLPVLPVKTRLPWLLVALTALALELTALYFQYGLRLDPCVLCVYQRTAVGGVLVAGLIGVIAPRHWLARSAGYVVLGISAAMGLDLALRHVAVQAGETLNCDFMADYPAWFKLDAWLPAVFEPTGLCGDTQWSLLGLGMPNWMVVVFGVYLVALVWAVLSDLLQLRGRGR
jgi:disulfide bond formation protein DsbB